MAVTGKESPARPESSEVVVGFLGGVRVLDFADASGRYASRLLADLGAEVIHVLGLNDETLGPPPYAPSSTGDVSLFDRFVSINSESIVVDLTTESGRDVIARLLAVSDLIIDTPDHAGVASHGFTNEELLTVAPGVNHLSIRSFGEGGPKSKYVADDLTVLASSGLLALGGYPDTGPVEVGGLQSYLGRSIYGVVGALMVLLQSRKDGVGRHVEVAAQEVMAGALEDTIAEYDFHGHVRPRMGGVPRGAGTGTFKCSDGYVAMVAGRLGTAKAWASLVRWLIEEKVDGAEEMADPKWSEYSYRAGLEATERFTGIFEDFASRRTKADLYHEGQSRLIPIAPVNSARDLLENAQLIDRGFFHDVADPDFDWSLTVPGRPYRSSAIDDLPLRLPPVNAKSSDGVLIRLLDLSSDEMTSLRDAGVIA